MYEEFSKKSRSPEGKLIFDGTNIILRRILEKKRPFFAENLEELMDDTTKSCWIKQYVIDNLIIPNGILHLRFDKCTFINNEPIVIPSTVLYLEITDCRLTLQNLSKFVILDDTQLMIINLSGNNLQDVQFIDNLPLSVQLVILYRNTIPDVVDKIRKLKIQRCITPSTECDGKDTEIYKQFYSKL